MRHRVPYKLAVVSIIQTVFGSSVQYCVSIAKTK